MQLYLLHVVLPYTEVVLIHAGVVLLHIMGGERAVDLHAWAAQTSLCRAFMSCSDHVQLSGVALHSVLSRESPEHVRS